MLLIRFLLWLWETPFYHHAWTPLKSSNHFLGVGWPPTILILHSGSCGIWRCSKRPYNYHGQNYYYTLMCFSPSPSRWLSEKSIVLLVYPQELGVFLATLASLLLISKQGNMCAFINSHIKLYLHYLNLHIYILYTIICIVFTQQFPILFNHIWITFEILIANLLISLHFISRNVMKCKVVTIHCPITYQPCLWKSSVFRISHTHTLRNDYKIYFIFNYPISTHFQSSLRPVCPHLLY